MRLKVRIMSGARTAPDQVLFSATSGQGEVAYRVLGEADVIASAAMDHDGHPVPLLRPVEGRLYRHEGGLLFLGAPTARDPHDPTFFLVKLQAMPSALRYFFEDQEGTELVSIPGDEVLRVEVGSTSVKVFVSAASIALPKEKIAYAIELAPVSRAGALLDGLAVSSDP
jgi:hypothetical protein